jgi:hypothetical protein
VATLIVALPRTLDRVGWLGLFSVCLITISGVVAMIGAGVNPVPGRVLSATVPTSFYQAFLAITNPVLEGCPSEILILIFYHEGLCLRWSVDIRQSIQF